MRNLRGQVDVDNYENFNGADNTEEDMLEDYEQSEEWFEDAALDEVAQGNFELHGMMLSFDPSTQIMTQHFYDDASCSHGVMSRPLFTFDFPLATCHQGVSVDTSDAFHHPESANGGMLISEYASSNECAANKPLLSVWVDEAHYGNEAHHGASPAAIKEASCVHEMVDDRDMFKLAAVQPSNGGNVHFSSTTYFTWQHTPTTSRKN